MFRTGAPDLIRRSVQGGVVSARNLTRIADAATRFRQSGPATMDGTGIYVRPSPATDLRFRYASAISDWEDNVSDDISDPRVSCRHSNRRGIILNTGEVAFWIYLLLRRPAITAATRYEMQQMPNVLENDTIKYSLDEKGDRLGLDYLDAPHLTVRTFSGDSSAIASGWGLMDGTANSSGNGGSGIDLRKRFVVSYDSSHTDYNTIGNAGGFWWHGAEDHSSDAVNLNEGNNNHPDHLPHDHPPKSPANNGRVKAFDQLAGKNAENIVLPGTLVDSAGDTISVEGVAETWNWNIKSDDDELVGDPVGRTDDLRNHLGPFNDVSGVTQDTDNRPPYLVLGYEERLIPF